VAVIAYEVGRGPAPGGPAPQEPARRETVEALFDALRVLLARAGYLNPQNPEAILAELRRVLSRAEPSQREVELLAAAVRAVDRLVRER
jgi:tRNA/rRNA methyltransferase